MAPRNQQQRPSRPTHHRTHLSLAVMVFTATCFTPHASSTFCPPRCSCNSDFTAIDCSDRVLFSIPSLPPTARSLDLSRNFLGPVLNGSIAHLQDLKVLDLSGNGLERLTDCSLVGLRELVKLNLSRNGLEEFPEALFDPGSSLEDLDLSRNAFREVPDAAFKNLVGIKSVDLSHNSLDTLRFGVRWQWLKKLEKIDLSSNDFREIPTDAFEMTHIWPTATKRRLSLANCRVESIRNGSLSQFRGLHSLDLSGNSGLDAGNLSALLREVEHTGVKELDLSRLKATAIGDLFHDFQHLALTRLALDDNAIESVPEDTFITLRGLQWLSLAGNGLASLEPGLAALGNLEGLDLSRNVLESFKGPVAEQLGQLQYLNLANNKLMLSSDVNFSAMRHLRHLHLENNALNQLPLPALTDSLEVLRAANNSITSLPAMSRMGRLRHFDVSRNELMHLGPYLLASAGRLEVADFRSNLIEEVDSRAFLPSAPRVVHLSRNVIRRLGYVSWAGAREIYLQENRLEELDLQTFHNVLNLTVLDLSRNNLTSVHADVFRHLGNLRRLDLHGNALNLDPDNALALFDYLSSLEYLDLGRNDLTFLNATTFRGCPRLRTLILSNNRFQVLDPALFENIPSLLSFDATNNPFHCSCELIPFRRWLGKTDLEILQPANGTYACKTPPWRTEKHVSFYSVSRFECNQSLYYMIIFGTVGAVIIITGVFSSILVHQYLKRRHSMKIKTGRHRQEKPDQKDAATDLKVDRVRFEHNDSLEKSQYMENLMRDPYAAFDKTTPQGLDFRPEPYPIVLSHPLILVEKKRNEEHQKRKEANSKKEASNKKEASKKEASKKEANKKKAASKKDKSSRESKTTTTTGSSDRKRHHERRERSSGRSSQRLQNLLRYYTFDPRSQREIMRASQFLARAQEHERDHPHYHTLPGPAHSAGALRDHHHHHHRLQRLYYGGGGGSGAPYERPGGGVIMSSRSYHHLPEGHQREQQQQQHRHEVIRGHQGVNLTRTQSEYPLTMTREPSFDHPRMSEWI